MLKPLPKKPGNVGKNIDINLWIQSNIEVILEFFFNKELKNIKKI